MEIGPYREEPAILESARRHGIAGTDMVHALRQHWRRFETEDQEFVMYVGPSRTGQPLEVGTLETDRGVHVVRAMPARSKFLRGWWMR